LIIRQFRLNIAARTTPHANWLLRGSWFPPAQIAFRTAHTAPLFSVGPETHFRMQQNPAVKKKKQT
jgi:hypothetical protein